MGARYPASQRQAEAGATIRGRPGYVASKEPLEDVRLSIWRDTLTRIGHRKHVAVGLVHQGHMNYAAGRRVPNRVVEQVAVVSPASRP